MSRIIGQYRACLWRDGARGEWEGGQQYFDCWGLVRHIRHADLGKPLLSSYGSVRRTMPRAFTHAQQRETALLQTCGPQHGAIASVFHGLICVHVAICLPVDGRLAVLEINPERNVTWNFHADWRRKHPRVLYHD